MLLKKLLTKNGSTTDNDRRQQTHTITSGTTTTSTSNAPSPPWAPQNDEVSPAALPSTSAASTSKSASPTTAEILQKIPEVPTNTTRTLLRASRRVDKSVPGSLPSTSAAATSAAQPTTTEGTSRASETAPMCSTPTLLALLTSDSTNIPDFPLPASALPFAALPSFTEAKFAIPKTELTSNAPTLFTSLTSDSVNLSASPPPKLERPSAPSPTTPRASRKPPLGFNAPILRALLTSDNTGGTVTPPSTPPTSETVSPTAEGTPATPTRASTNGAANEDVFLEGLPGLATLTNRLGDELDDRLHKAFEELPHVDDPFHRNVQMVWVPYKDTKETDLPKVALTALLEDSGAMTRLDYPIKVSRFTYIASGGDEDRGGFGPSGEGLPPDQVDSREDSFIMACNEITEGMYQECPDYEEYVQDLLDAELTIVRNVLHGYQPQEEAERDLCQKLPTLYEQRWDRETAKDIIDKIGSDMVNNMSPIGFLVAHLSLVFTEKSEFQKLKQTLVEKMRSELLRVQSDFVEAHHAVEERQLQQALAVATSGRSQKPKPVENEESWLGTARYGPFGPPDKPVFESWKVWEETILP